jgi:hypothetical protein
LCKKVFSFEFLKKPYEDSYWRETLQLYILYKNIFFIILYEGAYANSYRGKTIQLFAMSFGLFQIRLSSEPYGENTQQVKVILLRLKCNTVRYLTTIGGTNIPSEGISNFENGLLNAMQKVIIKFYEISVIS